MTKAIFLSLAVFLLAFIHAQSLYPDCIGKVNPHPLVDAALVKIDEIQHGTKYHFTNGSETYRIIVVNLTGNAYEHGLAMGKLLREEIQFTVPGIVEYLVQFVLKFVSFLPKFIQNILGFSLKLLFRELNNIAYFIRKPFIPQYFLDEMRGISEGAGVDYMDLVRMNMIPEMLKAFCSLVSAWGPATKDSHVYLLRALDWDQNAPISRYPVISIYHPEKGVPFANFGFAGLIGSLTAVSSNQIAIGEQLWGPVNGSAMGIGGQPWHFVLRDVAQFSTNLNHAQNLLIDAKRTCLIHMMIASGNDKAGRGVFYSQNVLEFYDDTNYTRHEQFPGTVYFPYVSNRCVESILRESHKGKIDENVLYRYVCGLHKTGDTFIGVFDTTTEDVYFAFSEYGTGVPAYERPHFKINMRQFYGIQN